MKMWKEKTELEKRVQKSRDIVGNRFFASFCFSLIISVLSGIFAKIGYDKRDGTIDPISWTEKGKDKWPLLHERPMRSTC